MPSSGGSESAPVPPVSTCPGAKACIYQTIRVGTCTVNAYYCTEGPGPDPRCWRFDVKPLSAGSSVAESPLCSYGYSANCAEADAAIDAYCGTSAP